MKIKFNQLVPNNYNPRKLFKDAAMEELKLSIKQVGLIEPLVVRKLKSEKYEVVCGMRRYYALGDLEIDEVECNVLNLKDIEAVDISFIENLQREDLSPIEEARMYLTRLKLEPEYREYVKKKNIGNSQYFPRPQSDIYKPIVKKYSKSKWTMHGRLCLLSLPENIRNAIHLGELELQVAEEISRLRQIKDTKIAQEYMKEIYDDYLVEQDTMSIGELKKRVKNKIDNYNRNEKEQEGIVEERVKEINKKIKETNKSLDQILLKLSKSLINVINEKSFKEVDFSRYKIKEFIFGDKENLTEDERSNVVGDGESILEFLRETENEYADNKEYENISMKITELENKIDDIQILFNRVKEKHIVECPFCYSGIKTKAINEKKLIHKEELDELKIRRTQLAGMSGFVSDSIKDVRKYLKGVESKEEWFNKFNKELDGLENA
ncbi:hypothetical protein LCGC14_0546760 [marine sediment metagenome]|uniref:ParB-like N-terminal domain-containing protein n=1 Tax=marine sediment metagenome TaxID=412755 RepID=A0A0F9UCM0_9ZZZZ